jgi:MFS family permease
MNNRWRTRLGIPQLAGHGRIVAAVALDSFGVGMFIPLNFLFFLLTTDLTVAEVGFGTSVATLLSLPLAPLAGAAVDRWGPKASLVANNLFATAGYLSYLLVDSLPALIAALFVVLCAERLYWASWTAFVADLAEDTELDRWYAFTAAGKNASTGLGSAAGAVLLASGMSGAAALIVIINAATSAITAMLFAFPGRRGSTPPARPVRAPESDGEPAPAGWRILLGDRTLLVLIGAQTALSFGWLIPTLVLPVYLVEVSGLPAWLPASALTLNALLIVVAQSALTARLDTLRRCRVISASAMVMVGTIALLALVSTVPAQVAIGLVFAAVLLFTIGQMAATPALTAISATVAPRHVRGRYLSLFSLTWALSMVTGPALVGALVEWQPQVLWVVLAALVGLGGLGYRIADRLLPERRPTPA